MVFLMGAAESLYPPEPSGPPGVDFTQGEQRFLIHGVSWKDYCVLREALDIPGLRMAFDSGVLELMSPSPLHEITKTTVARLLEMFAFVTDTPLNGYGSATFRREAKEKGAEPDECYCLGGPLDEYPDIVLEVVLTSGGLNKLKIYQSFGVQEVWFWVKGGFRLFHLQDGEYQEATSSALIPALNFEQLAKYATRKDQHEAVKEYHAELTA